ncbi:MAG: hypothetical protein K9K86_02855 [Pseudomonadales bacterium]|nr:hypothetical protein [Pseudomonadales bacterium]
MGLISRHLTQPVISWLNHREEVTTDIPLSDFEHMRHEIKPCDVILVEGRTRISEVIRQITQSSWTHAALYIGTLKDIQDPELLNKLSIYYDGNSNEQLVIESLLGFGTIVSPLSHYEKEHLRICRPTGLSTQDSQQVISFAVSRLGFEYDFRQILDLARFIFPWALWPRRWRSTLFEHNSGQPTKTVCSTMIAEAFQNIQFPILPLVKRTEDNQLKFYQRNPKLYLPRDFDYSPYFEIIKYPFFDCCDHGAYRLLPWHGSNAFFGEERLSE